MTQPLIIISNRYPGVWLEHVYDSIMYGHLFQDYQIALTTINAFIDLQTEEGQYPYSIKQNITTSFSQNN